MQTIKKIQPKSAANIYAYFLALTAFFTGLGIGFVNIANRVLEGGDGFGGIVFIFLFNFLYGILVGLISALLGAIVGFITGYIVAWFYNIAVRWKLVGGLKIELD